MPAHARLCATVQECVHECVHGCVHGCVRHAATQPCAKARRRQGAVWTGACVHAHHTLRCALSSAAPPTSAPPRLPPTQGNFTFTAELIVALIAFITAVWLSIFVGWAVFSLRLLPRWSNTLLNCCGRRYHDVYYVRARLLLLLPAACSASRLSCSFCCGLPGGLQLRPLVHCASHAMGAGACHSSVSLCCCCMLAACAAGA